MIVHEHYVYVYFRPNGIPCYVGKGKGKRWLRHKMFTSNRHLANLFKKHGDLSVVKVREYLTDAEAISIEIALIAAIGREENGGSLVNMTNGGDGAAGWKPSKVDLERLRGRRLSEETKQRLRDKAIAQLSSPEERQRLSIDKLGNRNALGNKSNSGRKFSVEHREKIRQASLKRWERHREGATA